VATNFEIKYLREGRRLYQLAVRRRSAEAVPGAGRAQAGVFP
jgi:hypothetical protein